MVKEHIMTSTKQYDCIIATMPYDEGLSSRQIMNVANQLKQDNDYIIFDTNQVNIDRVNDNNFTASVFVSVPFLDLFDFEENEFLDMILSYYDFTNVEPQEITISIPDHNYTILVI